MTVARLQPQRGRDKAKARNQARSAISSSLGMAGALRWVARCWPTTRQA